MVKALSNKQIKDRALRKEQFTLHSMMVPALVLAIIFSIIPMFGIIIAFQDFSFSKGIFKSQFVDIYNFTKLFRRPDFPQAIINTIVIALAKIVLITIFSIIIAILLNEVQNRMLKKIIQTTIFLPYFLSWALLGSLFVELFSINGSFNYFLSLINVEGMYWITDPYWFRVIVVLTDVWKVLGYQVVVFLAAMSTINPQLYEAAKIDGAGYFKLCWHITIPSIMPIIVLMSILNIANIMNAGFEQILVMYNPSVYRTGDILDTMSYRIGILSGDYSMGAAIGLFKSIISCICFVIAYKLADKIANYKIF